MAANLILNLSANSAKLQQGLDQAQSKLKNFKKSTTSIGDQVASSFLKMGAAVGGIAGTISFLKKSLESTEGSGDKLESVMGGAKEAVFEFQRSISTFDFSNFFSGLKEAYNRGKEFTDAMDDFADKAAYNDYKIAELERASAAEALKIADKTLSIETRRKASDERKRLEEEIAARIKSLAQKEYDIQKRLWESRQKFSKLSTEDAIKLYETVDNLTAEEADRLSKVFEGAKQNQLGDISAAIKSVNFGQTDPELFKSISPEKVALYGKYWELQQKGEADVMPKLFESAKKLNSENARADEGVKNAIKQNSQLLNQEEKKANNTDEQLRKLKEKNSLSEGAVKLGGDLVNGGKAGYADTSHLLNANSTLKTSGIGFKLDMGVEATKLRKYNGTLAETLLLNAKYAETQEMLASVFDSFNSSLSKGADSFKEFGKAIKSAAKEAIGAMIAEGVTIMILSGLKAAKLSGPLAIFLAPALAALGAGLATTAFNSLIPGFATGTNFAPGGLAMVGEQGPEIINLPRGTQVFNNRQSQNMLSGGVQEIRLRAEGGDMVGVIKYQGKLMSA